jgi:hypothetical protein
MKLFRTPHTDAHLDHPELQSALIQCAKTRAAGEDRMICVWNEAGLPYLNISTDSFVEFEEVALCLERLGFTDKLKGRPPFLGFDALFDKP